MSTQAVERNECEKPTMMFELKTEPNDRIVFAVSLERARVFTFTHLKLTNTTDRPLIFKIKCTDNNMFRIAAPVGEILPGTSSDVKVIIIFIDLEI